MKLPNYTDRLVVKKSFLTIYTFIHSTLIILTVQADKGKQQDNNGI